MFMSIQLRFIAMEVGVAGRAIADKEVGPEKIFVTTKIWNDKQDYESAKASIDESRI